MKVTETRMWQPIQRAAATLATALAFLAGADVGAQAPAGIVTLDRIVAVVNDDVIVKTELDTQAWSITERLRARNTPLPPDDVLRKQVLDRLVLERLQLQLAANTGIQINDSNLDNAILEIARRNNVTLDELRRTLIAEGYSYEKYREDLRRQITINQLQQRQVVNRVSVTDREVENFLASNPDPGAAATEYQLGHILIAVPEGASPEQIQGAQAKAEKVLGELREGADFARTAVAVSDGTRALEGGDLGWRKADELPTFAADAVRTMRAGDISDLIRSPSGFHILKVTDTRGQARHVVTQTRVRHILVRTDEVTSDADAELRLNQLRQRIVGGDDFGELARSHSDDSASAINGGELGWVSPGDLVPQFETEMNALSPGEMSQPFRTPFGWHVVQVLERRDHDSTAEFKKAEAREFIRERKVDEETSAWLRRLRDEAYVEYRLEE